MLSYLIKTTSDIEVIFLIIGGLSIFLFGLNLTKENLKNLASKRLEHYIAHFTNTTLKAFMTGIITTVLIQSSSGVTAIVVSFIASGYLSFPKGLAIMIGANVGTCTTAFLLGVNIENASLIIISLSSFFCFIFKSKQKKQVCEAFLGIGLVFLGLQLMGFGFDIVASSPAFANLLTKYADNFTFSFLLGIVLTFIIQSSSAIIGLLEQIYASGLLSLTSSIAILLGSNIGTTLTGFLSTISTNQDAKKAVVANIIFNVLGAILFIAIIPLFTNVLMLLYKQGIAPTKELIIAFSHLIFNVVTVILAYIFFDRLVDLTNIFFVPSKRSKKAISNLR